MHDQGISLHDVLHSRGQLRSGSSPGVDNLPPEAFKLLPYTVVVHMWKLFSQLLADSGTLLPESWEVMEFVGLPKTRHAKRLGGYRWLSKLAVLMQWYTKSWPRIYRMSSHGSSVKTYGFRKGHRCDDITSLLRECLVKASQWGRPIFIASLDVKTAVDSMCHRTVDAAMAAKGVPINVRIAVLQGLFSKRAHIRLPSVGCSVEFPFLRGGKQGGAETPDVFNDVMELCMEEVVWLWESFSFGFPLDDDSQEMLSHVTWADNVYLVASDAQSLQIMAQQLTDSIYRYGLSWKPSSLEFLAGNGAGDFLTDLYVEVPHQAPMVIKKVTELVALGVSLDAHGGTEHSMEHRLAQGQACYWSTVSAFHGTAGVAEKLGAWVAAPVACVLHGSSSWALSKHIVTRIRRWELLHLRKVFRMKRRPGEGAMQYNKRTSVFLDKIRADLNIPHMHHTLIRNVLRSARREVSFRDITHANPLQTVRQHRCHQWWAAVRDQPFSDRVAQGLVHARRGPTVTYETPFVTVLGEAWRAIRDATPCYNEWKQVCDSVLRKLCSVWNVPPPPSPPLVPVRGPKPPTDAVDYVTTVMKPFSEQPCQGDDSWDIGACCFHFICDNSSVQVLNGQAPLRDDTSRPVFERIARRTAEWIERGLQPRRYFEDPFEWRPRAFNVRSDAICNLVLDTGADINVVSDDLMDILALRPNFLIYSDGGCRYDGRSAIGWVIYATVWDGDSWRHLDVAIQGRVLEGNFQSFVCEAMAIDEATFMLYNIISDVRST